ncbi:MULTISPECIES: NmrA family NAD(P)-binding protein [Lactobacillus]|uniref:NmrA family NAD(P)-binding protein n=1 Tax=Lactobacillus TaxID=1578 RepID=UPI00066098CA|nr:MULTISPECIES: NmrA family NAD(P)-binding protein [Lactobacillus]VEF34742.1 nucleoside-diphosphate-sugar epimerase [Lactobacillus paragasseri]
MKYLITGATGNLGEKVTRWLRTMTPENNIRVGIHNLKKANKFDDLDVEKVKLDYFDLDTLEKAVSGVDLVIYIPSITYDLQRRITEFENVLQAVKKAKAKLIFVSFFADQENNPFVMSPFYAYVPRRLASSKVEYSIVKNSLYADPLVPYLEELIKRKNIIYPVGAQPLSFITRNDSAHAIACLAMQSIMRDQGQSYLLSMDKNYNMVELSYIMSRITDHKIGYAPVTITEFAKIYAQEGDGKELASMYAGDAKGLLSATSDDFHRLTGREPEEMEHFLRNGYQIARL